MIRANYVKYCDEHSMFECFLNLLYVVIKLELLDVLILWTVNLLVYANMFIVTLRGGFFTSDMIEVVARANQISLKFR